MLLGQAGVAVLRPACLELLHIGLVAIESVPPEGHQQVLVLGEQQVIALVNPGIGSPTVTYLAVTISDIHVPHRHFKSAVTTVTTLVEFAALAIAVDVVP